MERRAGDGRLRIVVGGFIGLLPAGGVTWDYVQYPLGFHLMGHDVLYLEDTGLWPLYSAGSTSYDDCSSNVSYLATAMAAVGLEGRWAYRDEVTGSWFGQPEESVREFCRTADVFVNVSCSTVMRDEYRSIPARALIDSDPMFTQIQAVSETAVMPGCSSVASLLREHNHHFTFGENVGLPGCRIPSCGVDWLPTRQPICVERWLVAPLPSTHRFTTVMNWSATAAIEYEGEQWGQKDLEILRLLDLPRLVPDVSLSLVIGQTGGATFPRRRLEEAGWCIIDANELVADMSGYSSLIAGSDGEFSVAKHTYVQGVTGWFSCRSACYLASGRPVVAQDTGWTEHLPSSFGLLGFRTIDEAAEALKRVTADPARHALAARRVAEDHFASDLILSDLLAAMGA